MCTLADPILFHMLIQARSRALDFQLRNIILCEISFPTHGFDIASQGINIAKFKVSQTRPWLIFSFLEESLKQALRIWFFSFSKGSVSLITDSFLSCGTYGYNLMKQNTEIVTMLINYFDFNIVFFFGNRNYSGLIPSILLCAF